MGVKVLTEQGMAMTSSSERELVRDMKENHCYVALDFEEEQRKCTAQPFDVEAKYTRPDGNMVSLFSERFRVPEVLFNPMMCGRELMGMHTATHKCVMSCDIDIRRD